MTPTRTPLIAGNWKLHKTIAEAEEFIQALLPRVSTVDGVDLAICPAFLALQAMVDSARGSRVHVYAQNMHHASEGAYTGEVSAPMLTEIGVRGVILGHSERREMFGESDKELAQKLPVALEAGLTAVLCVGETEEERERGDTERKLRHQVQEDLARVPDEQLGDVVIAYEPIWAIGTGKVATPEQAQEAIGFIRALVADRAGEHAERTRLLYGGSVNPDNAAELLSLPDVDGALVGGASLDAASFAAIVASARCPRLSCASTHRLMPPAELRTDSMPTGPSEIPVERCALIVLDGWGLADPGPGNAISLAQTPVFDELWRAYPHTQLTACGQAVGLPEGQMGNSEVGHMNLGAGAIVMQDLTRLDAAAADGTLADNQVLRDAFAAAERVHLIGLVSDGGVHSGWAHIRALIELGAQLNVPDLVLHAFSDGRDTLPKSGQGYLVMVEKWMRQAGAGRLGSVVGRYYAMDRDGRSERVQLAYDLLVHGRAEHTAASGAEAAAQAYARGQTDEFIEPVRVGEEARIRPDDSVVAFNFRPDRMRELSSALADPEFAEVDRGGASAVAHYTTMTEYEQGWPYPVAFPPVRPEITLPIVVARHGARQLHVAETEKYPHVTYFFGGGDERPQEGERRELVPSPRDVPTYDHKPEMSAREATHAFLAAWREDRPAFGIINFANPDMVGHTGVIPAAVKAVETVDACLSEVVAVVHESGGACVITADHGNSDHMLEPDGSPNTAHSLSPVPLIVTVAAAEPLRLRDGGVLGDVAPTVVQLLGYAQPPEMTGRSLIES